MPVRGALPLPAASHAGAGTTSGPAGSTAPDLGGPGSVVGPLALAVGSAGDAVSSRSTATQWFTAHARRRRSATAHAGLHGASPASAHARPGEDLTAPATPVYLVRDTVADDADAPASRRMARAVKRTMDVVCALVGLVIAAPILAILALLVRLTSPGAAFFAQARVGRDGRMFRCYKLRTMRDDAESLLRSDAELRAMYERNGFKIPCDADHRVTRIGRILRLTSCDELPQLWNVLKGEMSLVGPRPLVVRELAHYSGAEREVLLSVRPGLTGAWAVGGRSRVGYPRRAAMELDYVREWSLWHDVGILFRTVGAVLARRGAD